MGQSSAECRAGGPPSASPQRPQPCQHCPVTQGYFGRAAKGHSVFPTPARAQAGLAVESEGTHGIDLPSSRRRSGLGKTRHGYQKQKEHRVSAERVSPHTRSCDAPNAPHPQSQEEPRAAPLHLAAQTPWHEGLDTNLANRALAKASLILQPPENSLRREEVAERGYCLTQNDSVFACQAPCSPAALSALLSPRNCVSPQRPRAQHENHGPAGRWLGSLGAGDRIGRAGTDLHPSPGLPSLTATAVPGGSPAAASPQTRFCLDTQNLETYLVVCCCIFALKPSPARMTDALGKKRGNWNPATASRRTAQSEALDPQSPRGPCCTV